jgi:hypothetical protein
VHDTTAGHINEVVGLVSVEQIVAGLVGVGRQPTLAPAPVHNDGVDPDRHEERDDQVGLQFAALSKSSTDNSDGDGGVRPLDEKVLELQGYVPGITDIEAVAGKAI